MFLATHKGHQDYQIGLIDIWATLNVEFDTEEKQKRKEDQ